MTEKQHNRSMKKQRLAIAWFTCVLSSLLTSTLSTAEPVAVEDVNQIEQELGTNSSANVSVLPLEDLRIFAKTYEHIRQAYVTEIDDAKLLEELNTAITKIKEDGTFGEIIEKYFK